ncbi:MAG: Nif3-like dinuclear metal center hexameric protein [Bryobacterales bacterium]|nr:Nif3-like dinuclear metal center hexameric protein [Bryobacterales bacterium]
MTRRAALLMTAAVAAQPKQLTAGEIIARIKKEVAVPWRDQTVDTLKSGTPESKVTGIATTFMSTLEVLQKAVADGKNMIVTHEPTFYAGDDGTASTAADPIVVAKKAYIERHNIVIFRFHDHWHMRRPDGIRTGMLNELGWQQDQTHNTTLKQLAADVKTKLKISTVRVIGDSGQRITKVALNPGYANLAGAMRALATADVLIIGEAREWEIYEYVQDLNANGTRKALIVLGHAISEEGGMKECARWLKTFVPELPIAHIPAGELFWNL